MHIIQKDLDELVEQWSNHHIRKHNVDAPNRIPNVLHFLPGNEGDFD